MANLKKVQRGVIVVVGIAAGGVVCIPLVRPCPGERSGIVAFQVATAGAAGAEPVGDSIACRCGCGGIGRRY